MDQAKRTRVDGRMGRFDKYRGKIRVKTSLRTLDHEYDYRGLYLTASEKELKYDSGYGWRDVDSGRHFTDALNMPDLRMFLGELPLLVAQIQEKIVATIDKNDEVIGFLATIIGNKKK